MAASYLEYQVKYVPTGLRKLLYVNWPLVALVTACSGMGFVMLYSVAGGRLDVWAEPQIQRFGLGFILMLIVAMTPIWVWRSTAWFAYLVSIGLLVLVQLVGEVGMGAQRWIEIGPLRLQPSEVAKVTLVMAMAAYYDWLPARRVSNPLWLIPPLILIFVPVGLVLAQPNLGTAVLILGTGAAVLWCAGVHWAYFAVVFGSIGGAVFAVITGLAYVALYREAENQRRAATRLSIVVPMISLPGAYRNTAEAYSFTKEMKTIR